MDRTTNPYAPGAGTQPPELSGRDAILEDAQVALKRIRLGRSERGILLTGLRGVGKTVLLNRIRAEAESNDYIADLIEAPENGTLAGLVVPGLRQALLRLSRSAQAKTLAEHALRVLKSFTLSMNVGGAELSLKVDPEAGFADSGDRERDLADLLVAVGSAAKAQASGVAILIDELQYLTKEDLAALIVATHRIAQRGLPVAVFGAGLPSLPALSGDAKSYAERLFVFPRIGPLAQDDARRALAEPALALGVEFTPEALDELVRVTAGYPYFIQEWGYVVWNASPGTPITAPTVKQASVDAVRRLDDSFFRVRMDRVTEGEQRYMRALASMGCGPQKSGDVAARLGKRSQDLGPVRDSLIKKGMIYSPKHGLIEFTVPLFDDFMRRTFDPLSD